MERPEPNFGLGVARVSRNTHYNAGVQLKQVFYVAQAQVLLMILSFRYTVA
jgi:hypothetical protein